MPLDRFVPPDELNRVTEGSYEQLIERLGAEACKASDRLFGEACDVKLLSTFAKHAVVLAESGEAVRIRFDLNHDGAPMIVFHEPYKLQSVSKKDSKQFVETRSKQVVKALLEGDDAVAYSRAKELLPLLEDKANVVPPADFVKLVEAQLGRECAWKTAYEENISQIHKALGSDLGAIDQRRVEAKFEKLYDGSLPVEQREGYGDLVRSDLIRVIESYEKIRDRIGVLSEKFTALAASTTESDRALAGFALDFEEDVQRTAKMLRESEGGVPDIAARGQLHDIASRAIYRYDVAARYIETAIQDQG